MIDLMPNETIFIQWAFFLTALTVLYYFVFRPSLRIIQARRAATDGDEAKAAEFQQKSQELTERIEDNLARARRDGQETMQRLKQEGETHAAETLLKALERMDEHLFSMRAALDKESKSAEMQLMQYSQKLGSELAEKVLGRKVG